MKTNESVRTVERIAPLAAAIALSHLTAVAQTPVDVALDITAAVTNTSPVVTLSWPAYSGNQNSIYITRTELTATGRGRGKSFTLPSGQVAFADATAAAGTRYEYSINQQVYTAGGQLYLRKATMTVGAEVPLPESRGGVLLLVDTSVADAIGAELETYANDLALDGWNVVRRDVARMAVSPEDASAGAGAARLAEVAAVRQEVVDFYNANSAENRSVILIGRVPVPYSGKIMPDGHTDHQGAWPTDSYYADVNGNWTDVNQNWAVGGRLNNVPGDGKFDQNDAPSTLEMAVGRIDFAGLPGQGKSETELLRQYLVRNHAFRNSLAPFGQLRQEVIVDDNFGYFGGEAFASVGWNLGTSVVGRQNARSGDWFTELSGAPILFGYGCGGGGYTSVAGIGTSSDFATRPSRAVFNVLFGSYFGDWNFNDGLLRSSLGGPAESTGLTAVWGNRPNWDFSILATGETMGSTLRFGSSRAIHRTLLGDPTLRAQHRPAVANLSATPTEAGVLLTWEPVGQGEIGYHVFRTDVSSGTTVRVTGQPVSASAPDGSPITATEFLNTGAPAGTQFNFVVRPVFRENTPGGTFYDMGMGSPMATAQPGDPISVTTLISRQDANGGPVDIVLTDRRSEPRDIGGNLNLIIRFNQPVTDYQLAISGNAQLISQSLSESGEELTVQLGQVANAQCLRLNLTGVIGAEWSAPTDFSLPVRVLAGDVTGEGVVNVFDANRLALYCRGFRGVANPRIAHLDFNHDGLLNATDLLFALTKRGTRID